MQASDLEHLVGTEIGVTDWLEMTQDRINAFADATDDTNGFTSILGRPRPVRSAGQSPTGSLPFRSPCR